MPDKEKHWLDYIAVILSLSALITSQQSCATSKRTQEIALTPRLAVSELSLLVDKSEVGMITYKLVNVGQTELQSLQATEKIITSQTATPDRPSDIFLTVQPGRSVSRSVPVLPHGHKPFDWNASDIVAGHVTLVLQVETLANTPEGKEYRTCQRFQYVSAAHEFEQNADCVSATLRMQEDRTGASP